MALRLSIGESSQTGPRTRNEDYIGVVTPTTIQLETKGALLAVSDGVSGSAGGAEAAEMTVRSVSADYYATPDTWTIQHALDKVIQAANRWVLSQSRKNNSAMAGMATTLSLLVLRGQRYVLAHVGDTRIYQLREQTLLRLTDDHVWDRPDMRHVLKRAVGLDKALNVDYAEGLLKQGDIYAILSDGVWATLSEADIHKNLMLYHNPQLAAEALTQLALEKGGQDNASAIVVRIDESGQDRFSDLLSDAHRLPVPARMNVGDTIDDFTVTEILHDSRVSLLYQVKNRAGQLFVLKTLQPSRADDKVSSEALLNEEWLTKRVVSHVPQVLPLSREQRTALYYVMSWHAGTTLQQRLDASHHFTISGVANIAQDLMRGIGMLHRLNIVHRDIKPANIHLGSDSRLRILDLGVALNTTAPMPEQMENPGTPSFMAPELFDGHLADWRADIYAAGVTLYHLLTRKYPYGEIEPFQSPKFGEPIRPSRYRPEIPAWLENIILKAIARIPENRFETAEEMLLALEQGELSAVFIPRTPLIARARLVKWQWLAIISLCVNVLLIYWLLVS